MQKFPKILDTPQISRRQKGDMKQVSCLGLKHIRRQTTKFIRHDIIAPRLREPVGRLKTTEETKSWSRKY